MTLRSGLSAVVAMSLVAGCSLLADDAPEPLLASGPRLGELVAGGAAEPELAADELPTRPSAATVADLYERALRADADPAARQAAERRLAVLRLRAAEDALIEGGQPQFDSALAAIRRARATDHAADLAYLEARALALSGAESDSLAVLGDTVASAPDSPLAVEARFRRAEAAFSAGRWSDAAEGFGAVAAIESPLQLHARYMLGWSHYKNAAPQAALEAFVDVIGELAREQRERSGGGAELPRSLMELRADTLRVLAFAISESGGVESLAAAMQARGRPQWQLAIYEALVDARLRQERYLDTAAVLTTYIQHNPLAAPAPGMFLRRMEVLRSGGLLASEAELDDQREAFVDAYGRGSDWQQANDAAAFEALIEPLSAFLERLTLLAHAHAQDSGVAADWIAAARWYERRTSNLPDDPGVPQWLMLQAEALEQGGELGPAMAVLERMLALAPRHERAADAAYALTDLHARTGSDGLLAAQLLFVTDYADDPRAPAVAVARARGLYRDGQLQAAAEAAEDALSAWSLGDNERVARELAAAARFELGQHALAMAAYEQLLAQWPDDPRDYRERLLAATYQQAQMLLASEADGAAQQADRLLARLVEIDPAAELTVAGQFQRAAVAVEAERLDVATHLLTTIRQRWPDAARAQQVDLRLADLHERSGNLAAAADEYVRIAATAEMDAERRRLAAWRAAEIATELGDDAVAAQRFEDYMRTWPQPADMWVEALAARTGLARSGNGELAYWLERQVQYVEAAPDSAGSRARGLAAQAALELADGLREGYVAVTLEGDLATALARRRDALNAAFAGYERAAALGVLEVTSLAGFRAAGLFEAFAAALLDSPRPDLDADALAEYELLLEEQAFGFEERAIELHAANLRLMPQAGLDEGMRGSLAALERLYPARYRRQEVRPDALAQL